MATIRVLIPDDSWEALPVAARAAIEEVDFKSRASGIMRSVKPKALSILQAGKLLDLRKFCDKEADRLLKNGQISVHERLHVRDHMLEQVTGTVAGKKDDDRLRLYLCLGDRSYRAREKAPIDAWAEYAMELVDDRSEVNNRLLKWTSLLVDKFGELPREVQAAITTQVN